MAVRHSRPEYAHFIRHKHETSANGTNHPRMAQIIRKKYWAF